MVQERRTIRHDALGEVVSEKYNEAIAELHELYYDIRSQAEDTAYGYFHGGDPRNFSPDPECSTEAEREAHRVACAEWNAGKREPLPGPHEALPNGQGWITRSGFGLGVNTMTDEQASDWAERLSRILDRIESDEP